MQPATWKNCRKDLTFDGALVDLLVPGTGPAEWETFWKALRSGPFELRAFREGTPIPLPETAAWFFVEQEEAAVMASVLYGPGTANCFFRGGDVRLDIDPREVTSEAAFESVLALMRFLTAALGLPVFATMEGGTPKHAFVRVSPDGRAEFLPPGSSKRT